MKTINPRNYNVVIGVDDEVYGAIAQLAEPFVDDPNSVLRRKFGLDPAPGTENGKAPSAEPSRSPRRTQKKAKKKKQSGAPRAPKGSLTPEGEFELPILRALDDGGGELPVREVLRSVGEQMSDVLNEHDLLEDEQKVARWEKRVPFVRLRLVEHGLLDSDAPRGVWRITSNGRRLLKERRAEHAR